MLSKESYVVYTITDDAKTTAMDIAKQRRNFHQNYGSTRHWHDPEKGEYADEYWGVLGEILFRNRIEFHNLSHISDFPPLFSPNQSTIQKYDAKVNDKTIEIKSIPPDSFNKARIRLMIKESEFHDDDIYIAIKFWNDDEYSFCGYITKEELMQIPITTLKYSRGWSIKLVDLPHKLNKTFYI